MEQSQGLFKNKWVNCGSLDKGGAGAIVVEISDVFEVRRRKNSHMLGIGVGRELCLRRDRVLCGFNKAVVAEKATWIDPDACTLSFV